MLEEAPVPAADGDGDAAAAAAPSWPGGSVGLLLATLEETLAALDWMLATGDARLAPPFCQVHYNLNALTLSDRTPER